MKKGGTFQHPENRSLTFEVIDSSRITDDGLTIIETAPRAEAGVLREFKDQYMNDPERSYFMGTQEAETIMNGVRVKIIIHVPIGFAHKVILQNDGNGYESPLVISPFELHYIH